jgi:hypothetical protein
VAAIGELIVGRHPPFMRTLLKTIFWLGSGLVLLLSVVILWASFGSLDKQRRTHDDPRYAAEGMQAVEEFLRTDATSALKQLSVTNDLGTFLRLEGSGFLYPVWNIQGYHFLDLRRTAYFDRGAVPMRILVTEGRVTAPGLTNIGKPKVESGMIFVSHPEVHE